MNKYTTFLFFIFQFCSIFSIYSSQRAPNLPINKKYCSTSTLSHIPIESTMSYAQQLAALGTQLFFQPIHITPSSKTIIIEKKNNYEE